jgi:NADH dehydrogenase [ubiquinone] 1 alpha subcomplex assembly factor 1
MPRLLFNFADPLAVQGWRAIDDRVMGGASRSRLRADPQGHAVFEGEVSLAHGGGFASVRSPAGAFGGAGAREVVVETRGRGGPFKLALFVDDGFDSPAWQCGLDPAPGPAWQHLHLRLAAFEARFRGRAVPGAPLLDARRLRQVGLLTAGRAARVFALEVRSIVLA